MIYSLILGFLFPGSLYADTRSVFLKPDTYLEVRDVGEGKVSFVICEKGVCSLVGKSFYQSEDLQELAHADANAISYVPQFVWGVTNNKEPMLHLGISVAPLFVVSVASMPHHGMPGLAALTGTLMIWALTPKVVSTVVEMHRTQALTDKDVMYSALNRDALVRGQVADSFVRNLRAALKRVERGRYRGCAAELRFLRR